VTKLLPKLEDLENDYAQACLEFNPYVKQAYKRLERVDKKIDKIKLKIMKLYIGNKSNAKAILL